MSHDLRPAPIASLPDARCQSIGCVGIIGLGFVGKATAHAIGSVAEVIHHDPATPDSLSLLEVSRRGDVLFVCVPTPTAPDGHADVSIVRDVLSELARSRPRGPVVIRSTVPPGSTAAWAADFPSLSLVSSPEFLRQRHHLRDATSPCRTVLGWTTRVPLAHRKALSGLMRSRFSDAPVVELDATSAELLKYASNTLFGVKVSLANELAELGAALGLDWEPIRRALVLDPRIGDDHLAVPGPDGKLGFGGACLPKDMTALASLGRELRVALPVVQSALASNQRRRPRDYDGDSARAEGSGEHRSPGGT